MRLLRRNTLAVLVVGLLLGGCGGNQGMIPVTGEMIGVAGDTVGYITDASVAKEMAVHATLRNRDKMVRDAHAKSGFKLDWTAKDETIFLPGMEAPVVLSRQFPVVSFVEQADFSQALPVEPSRHPAWKTAETVLPSLFQATLAGTLGWKALDVLGGGWAATAPTYHGPVESYNPITTTSTVAP